MRITCSGLPDHTKGTEKWIQECRKIQGNSKQGIKCIDPCTSESLHSGNPSNKSEEEENNGRKRRMVQVCRLMVLGGGFLSMHQEGGESKRNK